MAKKFKPASQNPNTVSARIVRLLSDGNGYSTGEIAAATDIHITQVRSMVYELERYGAIEHMRKRDCRVSNRRCPIYRITEMQASVLAQSEEGAPRNE